MHIKGENNMFINENVNPKRKTSDCVIRAICKAENKPWLEVFDSLVAIARKDYTIPNTKDAYDKYLNKYEKINVFHMVNGKKKRYTVKEICEFKGTYIVSIANHMVAVVNGNYYDLWDCGDKSAYVIWKVK
jgi:hypothetical protein